MRNIQFNAKIKCRLFLENVTFQLMIFMVRTVRLYNPETQLAMIKVPRDSSDIVRSAITLLTEVNDEPIVATVISTNGCPRTAKLAALRETKRIFQVTVAGKGATGKKELRNLEDQMDQIRNID